MTKEIIHICCSDSAQGSMNYAIKKGLLEGKKAIGFPDDLSNGPINDITNINKRIDWVKNIYIEEGNKISKDINSSCKKFNKNIMNLKEKDIYLWYGNSATEICGMLHVLSMLEEKIHNVYTINVSEITYNTGKRNEYASRVVGEVIIERLGEFIGIRQSMDFSRYSSLMGLWEELKKENTNLRVYDDNQVKSVQIDYFDDMILRYTNNKFRHSARTVGEVMGRAESYVSDTFIFWRVIELIRNEKIEYRGSLGSMRELEIKNHNT
ncbi:DUF1835 domain-containing protein [Clostridium psychrophilum]|uniref:DUF1835 domain-containing protein n=1 Tax=Clostridium psychrophilum TaxID=132926 RepID=UPI001C0E2F51|nr:DUF1835 domain-containing protein [Clostridium psychrophilum]MBU3183188.1 DUF1835 domain-containing protein [Clostridium psychrophilum]